MLRFCRIFFATLFFAALSQHLASAQGITTGSITGTVVDGVGASVVGASVSVLNTATGAKVDSLSRGTGDFTVRDLPIGTYTVTIGASGFSELKVENVIVNSGNATELGKE